MSEAINIWRAALDEADWPGPERLPAEEQERAGQFLRPQAARRWVASRWALRRVLASYLDEPVGEIEFEIAEHGKPRLAQGGGIEFSLSHSNGLALVAVAEGCEVGVDVELIEPERDLWALAERGLPQEDATAVQAADARSRPAVFYSAWTRHEARGKCLGTGLGVSANLRSDTSEVLDRRLADPAVANVDVAPGYAAAIAVMAAEVGPIDCRSLRA